uniref:Uncharacterized protein n=1 Tax=Phlebotomus papatasi TaxID=29031 RepID=A0A1B0D047_PHLPP
MSRKMCGNHLHSIMPKIWNDPNKGIQKILIDFQFSSIIKASEISRCLINVSAIEDLDGRESEILGRGERQEIWIELGTAKTPIDCYIEILLREMLTGEKSRCFIATKSGQKVSFTLKLLRIDFRGYLFELGAQEIVNLAQKYREIGVEMFKKYPVFAQDYFNRAAKCVLSLGPLQPENQEPTLDGLSSMELERLLEGIYSNISACLLKQNRLEEVLYLMEFTKRNQDVPDKAIYRKALAHHGLKQFEEAKNELQRLNYQNNKELLALWNKNQAEWRIEEDKYAKMVQKMFTH